jgi:hypothetical protein
MSLTDDIDAEGPRAKGYWIQEHSYLSPNALVLLHYILSPPFQAMMDLVSVIDAGDAEENEAEHDLLYDNIAEVVDTVCDLYNMVRRRDQYIAQLEAQIAAGDGV